MVIWTRESQCALIAAWPSTWKPTRKSEQSWPSSASRTKPRLLLLLRAFKITSFFFRTICSLWRKKENKNTVALSLVHNQPLWDQVGDLHCEPWCQLGGRGGKYEEKMKSWGTWHAKEMKRTRRAPQEPGHGQAQTWEHFAARVAQSGLWCR